MNENIPTTPDDKAEKIQNRKKRIALALEMIEKGEVLPFPGIDYTHYLTIRAEQEELPGYSTPIDVLIDRFQIEGMKIVLGKNPETGNIFILPGKSDDIENDSLLLKHLKMEEIIGDDKLFELVLLSKM